MKMRPEDYLAFKNYIKIYSARIDGKSWEEYKTDLLLDDRVKDLEMRFRWDVFGFADNSFRLAYQTSIIRFLELYDYLDDTHIDTALRQMIGELKL